jgi:hypothetical protein
MTCGLTLAMNVFDCQDAPRFHKERPDIGSGAVQSDVNRTHHDRVFPELYGATKSCQVSGKRFERCAVAFRMLQGITVDRCAMGAKVQNVSELSSQYLVE